MSKKSHCILLLLIIFCINFSKGQAVASNLHDSLFSTYYQQRVSHFRTLPSHPNSIIFLGNSITDGAEWSELFNNDPSILNRGISGDMTAGVLNRLDEVVNRKPAKIFLLIGTNDLAHKISPDSVLKNIYLISEIIHAHSPVTKLYIQSITPVNKLYANFPSHSGNGKLIQYINANLRNNANKYGFIFIDIHTAFADSSDKFRADLTNDGLHLKGDAYQIWKDKIYPYVYDLQQRPSLIPMPKKLSWTNDLFPIYHATKITINNDSLVDVAGQLKIALENIGYSITIGQKQEGLFQIGLSIVKDLGVHSKEAYRLDVTGNMVKITSTTIHGIFNGIQTLKQLMRNHSTIPGCHIVDYPSFSWRGYMVDVGRNYQSVALLKQQIDQMAALKLNVFHFHVTEDVAWRWQLDCFAQLTDPGTMTRDAGLFYSKNEIKDLIHYCKERQILFLPEIDMPGHSAAFKRAMGFSMQSDSGTKAMKIILEEICKNYNLPYIHIGADEVKITNKAFLPQMINLIEHNGIKVIGWEPGGNFTNSVIRQLWRDDNGAQTGGDNFKKIDSRNLYVNHMDAEESVPSIYNHQICDVDSGSDQDLGATLCLWNDRKLNTGMDNLIQNPVYPSMLAFAERTWVGGGILGNHVNIDNNDIKGFTGFENRLLDIKREFYSKLPFPYVRQANIQWQLIGPFDNRGNLDSIFPPETSGYKISNYINTQNAIGATIILRHFWNPVAKGIVKDPKPQSTYYAYATVKSVQDTTIGLWVGFYDYSRSTASDPPKSNTWNNLHSKIWINNQLIPPPIWTRADQKGDLEIPYTDENYYFRKPATIHLKKGNNTILVKLPVDTFNNGIWYSPIKWSFTAVFVEPSKVGSNYEQAGFLYPNLQ